MAVTDKLLNGSGLSHLASTIKGELADKQDSLVSGTNIKTVNNNSLLGSGNITISGSDPSVAVSTTEPTGNEVVWINPSGSADTLATVATTGDYNDLSNKLTAGENITIVTDSEGHNTISASGGGASDWDDLTNKPFESIGTGLSVDSEGNLNAEGGGSSYTFTNGLTESSGTVSWDLNDRIKTLTPTAGGSEKSLIIGDTPKTINIYGNGEGLLNLDVREISGSSFGLNIDVGSGSFVNASLRQGAYSSGSLNLEEGSAVSMYFNRYPSVHTYKGSFIGGYDDSGNTLYADGYGSFNYGYSDNTYGQNRAGTGSAHYGCSVMGVGVKANSRAQHVIGQCNVEDNTKLFIIGNGSADNNRSNALTVD